MQILRLVQGSKEWVAHRKTAFNASDAPSMMGCSPYRTRSELLHELATGITPEVTPDLQRRFDDGHRYEALARPLGEEIIGEELYPVVGSEGTLSASFDGLTLMNDIAFEHKSLNSELRDVLHADCKGFELPMLYQVQMEQQCMVSGAKRVLFMASKWDGDMLVEERHCWYMPNHDLAAKIRAGWAQFAADLAAYVPTAPAAAEPTAAVIEQLPALVITVEGKVVSSNLHAFRDAATAFLANIKTDLQTDQDFADAEKTVTFCEDGEKRLELVKAQALSQTASIDELFRTIDLIKEQMRQKRLALDKSITTRKVAIRAEIVTEMQAALDTHHKTIAARLGANWVGRVVGGFGDAMKGKRTVATARDAASVALANAKIDMSALADRLDANRKSLATDEKDWLFLFADFSHVGNAPAETFSAVAAQRIQKHKDAEAERQRQLDEQKRRLAEKDEPIVAPAAIVAAPAPAPAPAPVGAGPSVGTARVSAVAVNATLNAGHICKRLGFVLTVDFITNDLGIPPHTTERRATLWTEAQFRSICLALVAHVSCVSNGEAVAA